MPFSNIATITAFLAASALARPAVDVKNKLATREDLAYVNVYTSTDCSGVFDQSPATVDENFCSSIALEGIGSMQVSLPEGTVAMFTESDVCDFAASPGLNTSDTGCQPWPAGQRFFHIVTQ